MKKISLIFLFFLGFTAVQSQHFFKSKFSLTMLNHNSFSVRLDNRFYPNYTKEFTLENVKPGQHFIEVIKYRKKKFGEGSIPVVICQQWISIPSNAHVIAFVDENHFLRIAGITGLCISTTHIPVPSYTGSEFPVMTEIEFRDLKQALVSAPFESSRMIIAKQAVSKNKLLSRQVQELMKLFWFESSRLEIAKFAFSNTYDQENYFIVNNAFQFDSSIRELDDYLNPS